MRTRLVSGHGILTGRGEPRLMAETWNIQSGCAAPPRQPCNPPILIVAKIILTVALQSAASQADADSEHAGSDEPGDQAADKDSAGVSERRELPEAGGSSVGGDSRGMAHRGLDFGHGFAEGVDESREGSGRAQSGLTGPAVKPKPGGLIDCGRILT